MDQQHALQGEKVWHVITISAGCKHTVQALTTLDIIEVQLGEEISAHDKIKVEM